MTCVNLVSTLSGNVGTAKVKVAMDHPWVGDLVFKLKHPDGTLVTLMSRPGKVESSDAGTDYSDTWKP